MPVLRHIAAVLALPVVLPALAIAQPLGTNLVINGDAEAGDASGWIDDGVQVVETSVPGIRGLPAGTDIGDFSFTGGTGDPVETLTQEIDVSARSAAIDGGSVTSTFSVLTQSRRIVGAHDRGIVRLQYRTADGMILASEEFEDEAIIGVPSDWTFFEDVRVLPAGTRVVWIQLVAARDTGLSTDAYFDNVSVVLAAACRADLDGDGALTIFDFLAFQNLFDAGDPAADFDGDGSLTIFDFLAFQNAFDAGCP